MQKLCWPMMAKTASALLCAALWLGPARAADSVPDYMLYYTGEREFCRHLLKNAHKAEKIEPVLGPTFTYDLDFGERYAPRTRLYFVNLDMPIRRIMGMVRAGNWKAILGYTPWKAESSAGRIVPDPRWRKYDDQCPGIFRLRHYKHRDEIVDVPIYMTMFEFDANGDGKRNKIYRYKNKYDFFHFEVADFNTCTLKPILSHEYEINFYRFEDKNYLIAGYDNSSATVYRINAFAREIDSNDHVCYFSTANHFTKYLGDKRKFDKPNSSKPHYWR